MDTKPKSGPVNGSWSVETHLLEITVVSLLVSLIEVDNEYVIPKGISVRKDWEGPDKGMLSTEMVL